MGLNKSSLFVLLAGALISGCGLGPLVGSGVPVRIDYSDESFSSASFSYGCSVAIESSDSVYVEVTIDDNLRDYLRVSNSGGVLTVGLMPGNWYRPTVFSVRVGSPHVNRVAASGGSRISATTELAMDSGAHITLSGGSAFSGRIHTSNITLHLSGGSTVSAQGAGGDVVIQGSGGSIIRMESFSAVNCSTVLSGGSSAQVHASGVLSGALSGGSTLTYTGAATRGEIVLSGGSRVSQQ